jgi:hypothetical protein
MDQEPVAAGLETVASWSLAIVTGGAYRCRWLEAMSPAEQEKTLAVLREHFNSK